ncbi:hypothetical protein H6A65_01645 [Mediterraneibacter glycyrrhizinilyticus]|uniref:hypothetical protein n=1 Tax=Mediterraneibacter glycyrrhizinilyticus TaxID=342942 RepID=UPI001961E851|nr:hypothetical protein [Mediterraneibacter glycyrrhizinilyticus]MBM6750209.1 hypothetical protein [Mediterraneibacter glycyrrhizinilyticus]
MKKFLLGLTLFSMLFTPVTASADNSTFDFRLGGEDWYHESIAPDEFLEDKVIVTNASAYPLEFRLIETENLEDSDLYEVMQYSIGDSGYMDLAELSSDWYEVESGETAVVPVVGYLPDTLGNDWQGKELNARFHFVGRLLAPEGTDTEVSVTQSAGGVTVKTGDSTEISGLCVLLGVSALIILVCVRRCLHERR